MRERTTIGQRIRCVRKEAGETQAQMGDRLGVYRHLIMHWEHDRRWPDAVLLADIAETYGVSCDWLLLGEGGDVS